MFDSVPGYEGTVAGGEGGYFPPPTPTMPMPVSGDGPNQPNWNIPSISEDAAREAFVKWASSKCCCNTGPAKDGNNTNVEHFYTYRYRLETFTESRSAEWLHKPYSNQPTDAGIQRAPGPWEIAAQMPGFFQDSKQKIKVPYTTSVKRCFVCVGSGMVQCRGCAGCRTTVCGMCNGSGFHLTGSNPCMFCKGQRRVTCLGCNGKGANNCSTCCGKKQLLVFINLKVQWTNNKEDFVAEQSSGLKVKKFSKVSGIEIFKDSQIMLYPLMDFPEPAVAQASERLIKEHMSKYGQMSRILQQRHMVELILVTRVTYTWKGKSYMYFVFGNEMRVSAKDYPATCCCSVM